MAREKVEVTRKPTANKRQGTFTKRKKGLMKKVKELSILCGVQVALLAFSPSGKPNLILGENRLLFDVVLSIFLRVPLDLLVGFVLMILMWISLLMGLVLIDIQREIHKDLVGTD